MSLLKRMGWVERGFQIAAVSNSLTVLVVLSVYAYGGLSSRYRADDYCESANVARYKNIFEAVIQSYNEWLNSYSTLFFVKLTDLGGLWGLRLWPGLIILLWVVALIWLFSEIEKILSIDLGLAVKVWVSGLAIFLSLYQTPVLFQVLYWRPVSIPYTLPLVFFIGIAAFLLWYARQPYQESRAVWVGICGVLLVFFAGGLGETDAAFQVGLLAVAVFTVWLTRFKHQRRDVLTLLVILLFSAGASILTMAVSPGTAVRLANIMTNPPIYNPVVLSVNVIIYASQFLFEFFKVAPLPNLIAFITSLAIMYFRSSDERNDKLQISSLRISSVSIWLLVFMFLVIGFSFAPSAFVRTFPVARARFPAYFLVVFVLILQGGLIGVWLSRLKLPVSVKLTKSLIVGVLTILMIYPLQSSSKIYTSFEPYRNFAVAWDERDAQIRRAFAEGTRDLVVVQLDSVGDVGEYKGFGGPNYWINICAADYYGLHTLVAP
jgi:hypothetical protein